MNEMIDWNNTGHHKRVKFVIPVGNPKKKWWQFWKKSGTTPKEAEKAIADLISKYKEDISWDESGTISTNKEIPFTKEFWFPSPNDEDVDLVITLDEKGNIIYKK